VAHAARDLGTAHTTLSSTSDALGIRVVRRRVRRNEGSSVRSFKDSTNHRHSTTTVRRVRGTLRRLRRNRLGFSPEIGPIGAGRPLALTGRTRRELLPVCTNPERVTTMHATMAIAVLGSVGITACATTHPLGGTRTDGVTMKQFDGGVRVEQTQVVDTRVHPLVPVRTAVDDDGISIHHGRPRKEGVLARLRFDSLSPISPEARVASEAPSPPSTDRTRVAFEGGRFVECFLWGSRDEGFQLMAQEWTAYGSRMGSAVPISPPDADVIAVPQLVSIDGRHAIAAFVATSGERFELFAVSLEVL